MPRVRVTVAHQPVAGDRPDRPATHRATGGPRRGIRCSLIATVSSIRPRTATPVPVIRAGERGWLDPELITYELLLEDVAALDAWLAALA